MGSRLEGERWGGGKLGTEMTGTWNMEGAAKMKEAGGFEGFQRENQRGEEGRAQSQSGGRKKSSWLWCWAEILGCHQGGGLENISSSCVATV